MSEKSKMDIVTSSAEAGPEVQEEEKGKVTISYGGFTVTFVELPNGEPMYTSKSGQSPHVPEAYFNAMRETARERFKEQTVLDKRILEDAVKNEELLELGEERYNIEHKKAS